MLAAVKNYFIGGDGSSQVSSNSSIATVVAELKQLVVGLREEMKDIKLQLSNVDSRISAPYQDVTSLVPHLVPHKCFEELEEANHSYFIMRSGSNDYAGPIPFSLFCQDIDALNASLRVFSDKVYHDNVYIVPYILEVQDIESGDLGYTDDPSSEDYFSMVFFVIKIAKEGYGLCVSQLNSKKCDIFVYYSSIFDLPMASYEEKNTLLNEVFVKNFPRLHNATAEIKETVRGKLYFELNHSMFPSIIDESIVIKKGPGNFKKCTDLSTYAPDTNQTLTVQVTTFILVAYWSTLGLVKKKELRDFDKTIEKYYNFFKDPPNEIDDVRRAQQIFMCFCLSQLPSNGRCFFAVPKDEEKLLVEDLEDRYNKMFENYKEKESVRSIYPKLLAASELALPEVPIIGKCSVSF